MALKRNLLANYLSQGLTALMGLAFIPVYIRYLGAEAYGLIGFYAMLQVWLTLLDLGIAPTISREVARYQGGAHTAQSIRDLLRTLEVICLVTAVLVALVLWMAADWLSRHWINVEVLQTSDVALAISVIGIVIALRVVEGLYRGVVVGMQSFVWLSGTNATMAVLRWGGAALVLVTFQIGIVGFFVWQALVSLLTLLLLSRKAQRSLPRSPAAARISIYHLQGVRRFAAGVLTSTALSLVLTQADKLILSKMLSLQLFGYYTLAGTVAAALYQLTAPLTQAYYPRLTELVARRDFKSAADTYHQGAQMVSVVVAPSALTLYFFSEELLTLWTGNAALARAVSPTLGILALGTMFNALMHVPHSLSLAYGWPGFLARLNLAAIIVLVPAILVTTPRYGVMGAASIWLALNVGYVVFGVQYLHRHVLPPEKLRWYVHDTAKPVLAALIASAMVQWVYVLFARPMPHGLWILASAIASLVAAVTATPTIRHLLLAAGRKLRDRAK